MLPDARAPVDAVRLDDDDPPDLVPELLFVVLFLPVLLLVLLLPVLLLVLLLPVLLLPVLRLELLFAVLLAELLFAVVLFADPRPELLFAGLFLPVLLELLVAVFLPVLLLAVLRLAVVLLLELLLAVLRLAVLRLAVVLLLELLLLELLLAVLFLPVPLLLAPERFFAPLRLRDEPPRPPSDSASMSSSFRIREAPAIPARVARLRSSATVMSSMLRATSAPSPFPLTCAVATPVRRRLITTRGPCTCPFDAQGRGSHPAHVRRPRSRGAGYTGREARVAAMRRPVDGPGRVPGAFGRHPHGNETPHGGWSTGSRRAGRRSGGRAPIRAIVSRTQRRSRALDCWRTPPRTRSAPRA